ncbi:MAG: Mur ligase family protein, partial [Mariprofundaceae bacterium]
MLQLLAMKQVKHIHVLGICGTAMAAIAKLAKDSGYRVTGSDQGIYPPMSDFLAAERIKVARFSIDNLHPKPDMVVIGNAMSRGNVEVEGVLDLGIPYLSGPEFMGKYILPGRYAAVVTGTHGKTTTSSLLAHILASAGLSPGFMIGGIPEDFGTGSRLGDGDGFVLEGDEYDTAFFDKRSKFLHYQSRTLILNNLEFDHADIFADLEAIKIQFHHLIRTVPASGQMIVNADDENIADVLTRGCWTPITSFGKYGHTDSKTEWQWQSLAADGSEFKLYQHGQCVIHVRWNMIGIHNVSNACAV